MGCNIIIISADPWAHYTWRRRHHVAWNLAKENKILFIEPPISIINPLLDIGLSWKHLFNLGKLKHQGRNLYSYSPCRFFVSSLPFSKKINYEELNKKIIFKKLKHIVDKLGMKDPILWIYYHPYHYDYYGLFNEKIVVADWYDKFTAQSGETKLPDSILNSIKVKEDMIVKNSDIIFTVSEELKKDFVVKHDKVVLVPHGVDIDSFINVKEPGFFAKKYLKKIKKPVLGFLGLIHNKIDFNLLNYVAESRQDWSILLIGKKWLTEENSIKSFNELIKRKNVYYTREIKKEFIPYYLNFIDVCLMPFKKVEFNKYTTGPLKLLQYFAAGKPVVAVNQGVKLDYNELIKTADTKDEFIKKIEECLAEIGNKDLIEKRLKIAKENSWEKRVEEMLELIEGKSYEYQTN